MGLLTERGAPSWHPASPELKAACARAAQYCRTRGVDIARLAIQFSMSHPDVATTLVGIANPAQITTDTQWISEPLDDELLAEVQAILAPVHNMTWPSGRPENSELPLNI